MLNSTSLVPLKIVASGVALPSQQVLSTELDKRLNKSNGYVEKRSGIRWRYHASNTDSQAELAAAAIQDALIRQNIAPSSIDALICASAIPVQALPCSAAHILSCSSLLSGIACFDINASCVSYLSALQVSAGLLATNQYQRIAIVSADIASRGIDWEHEESSLIFGDGAACTIVERGDGHSGILSFRLETYPEGLDLCEIRAGGTRCNPRSGMQESDFLFHMKGKPLFKMASAMVEDFMQRILSEAGVSLSQIDTVVPHQASHLSLEHMRKRLGVTPAQLVHIYATRGNQVAASIPSALHEAIITDRFYGKSLVMLVGTAAGLALSAMVIVP
ncbi:ketoacyl-ACP synthase III [Providencia rustigianii]|uniref:3-oxoacyl-[acyl-carrier-protein] synthase III C-terminal domain-containing protein n=1 Tax=Providencia rustigianii TaxID=158850 RepID=UPI000F6CE7D3|nr:3-oxoacyl-[acyl-carrier-protein] synthase III C-terminal domain-containing protein [Providencia rustigianii]MTC58492.1 ketoacyl-ACP synthase III [Providencia rustigianii]VEH56706.1 3-oxoacyl-[acyl-carrier-protein] synthase 3 [Providencia rustigianii]